MPCHHPWPRQQALHTTGAQLSPTENNQLETQQWLHELECRHRCHTAVVLHLLGHEPLAESGGNKDHSLAKDKKTDSDTQTSSIECVRLFTDALDPLRVDYSISLQCVQYGAL